MLVLVVFLVVSMDLTEWIEWKGCEESLEV